MKGLHDMPVGFLTEAQRSRYGRFNTVPSEEQLAGFFHLDAAARSAAMSCRGARAQVGYAVQLGTVRFGDRSDPGEVNRPGAR